ncbi:uncharacterized protein ColSpa_09758 [Colletotrichum spaethianum]|uniref:Rhodopsin domain-containing protein n=1 Tax=Colletotrichum spaethianum TaxID=700344 RepID=A0AA37UQV9_9PEZI|nr:uncharacterized protein ColSpa_09758 [Colletotrichum spaethianum]GKT49577.1 hypothetical protein ColSpa_09758 [Colletotrichum spaethianum]
MASGSTYELLHLSLRAPSPSPTLSPAVLKEIDDADVPFFMTGIFLPHAICTLFILARVVSRVWVIRKWYIDDTLIFLAWLFSSALCVVYGITAATPWLLGAPPEAASEEMDVNPYIMRTYLGLIYYQLCLCLTKLSILAFYLRMFACRPTERYLAWAAIVFVFMYSAPMLLMSFLQCHPVRGQFFGHPMVCFDFPDLLISSASLHSATDAWLIIMVIPCVMRLDIPRRQKVALGLVMSMGIFVIAASMIRLQLSLHLHYQPNSSAVRNTLGFFVMTVLECDIALICASAPTLRPLLARVFFGGSSCNAKRKSLEANTADSFDLTSLTYHGYPWATTSTSVTGSRNASVASHLNKLRMPAPPAPVRPMAQRPPRPPTTLHFGDMIVGTAPRGKGCPLMEDTRPMLNETWEMKRSSSIYSQDSAWDGPREYDYEKGAILKTMRLSLRSEYIAQNDVRFKKNEPLNINRWSPTSGLSGDTWAADRSSSGTNKEGMERKVWADIPREEEDGKPQIPLRSPLRDSRR